MSIPKENANIPILEPLVFKKEFIVNNRNAILTNSKINEFFIHSFKEDLVNLKLPLPPHKKTVNDFVFILKGKMTKTIELESFSLQTNDFLFTPKNTITTSKNFDTELEGFYCHFSDLFLANNPYLKLWQTQPISQNLLRLTDAEVKTLMPILNRIMELYREMAQRPTNYRLIAYYLSTFIAEVSIIAENQFPKAKIHPLVSTFNQLVKLHFKESKSVRFYADRIHISPNHLNKIIKNSTGKTASTVINQVCILEAKVLLIQTNLDISEVALELGYDDTSYFSRFFKRHTGIPPSKYRKMIELS